MRITLIVFVFFSTLVCSFSQTNGPITTVDDYKGVKKSKPGLQLKHSLGLNVKEYIGLGVSYRYRPVYGLGFQVSYSPKISDISQSNTVEMAGLYTLLSGTVNRYFLGIFKLRGKKDFNIYLYQSNTWNLFSDNPQNSHSINIGYEEIYWKRISTTVTLGYIIYPKTNFNVSVSFGAYYRF